MAAIGELEILRSKAVSFWIALGINMCYFTNTLPLLNLNNYIYN